MTTNTHRTMTGSHFHRHPLCGNTRPHDIWTSPSSPHRAFNYSLMMACRGWERCLLEAAHCTPASSGRALEAGTAPGTALWSSTSWGPLPSSSSEAEEDSLWQAEYRKETLRTAFAEECVQGL